MTKFNLHSFFISINDLIMIVIITIIIIILIIMIM